MLDCKQPPESSWGLDCRGFFENREARADIFVSNYLSTPLHVRVQKEPGSDPGVLSLEGNLFAWCNQLKPAT
jgi:hypothetical protein